MVARRRNCWLSTLAIFACTVGLAPALPALASEHGASFAAALESIRRSELAGYVKYLASEQLEGRQAGSRGGHAAARFLAEQFARLGLEPAGIHGAYWQPFDSGLQNVVGRIEGRDARLQKQVVVVGAHFDHIGYGTRANNRGPIGLIHPGADDNASGVAALLEMAEAFSLLALPPKRSVLFICFDGEEIALLGSTHWANHPTVPIKNVTIMVNLDMLGRLRNERVYVMGTRSGYGLRRLVCQANAEQSLHLVFPWTLKANADHWPFFRRRVPVLMFHTGQHEDYHTPRDRPERLNYAGLEATARLVFRVVCALADRSEPIRFRPAAASETEWQRRQLATRVPRLPDRLGVAWERRNKAGMAKTGKGVRITRVIPGSAAYKAGLRVGDRILEFAGRKIASGEELIGAVRTAPSKTTMLVARADGSEPVEVPVELAGKQLRLGVVFRQDEAEPGTAIVTYVIPGTPAHRAGLRRGDRIWSIAGRKFTGRTAFAQVLAELSGRVRLEVEREGRVLSLWVEFPESESAAGAESTLQAAEGRKAEMREPQSRTGGVYGSGASVNTQRSPWRLAFQVTSPLGLLSKSSTRTAISAVSPEMLTLVAKNMSL